MIDLHCHLLAGLDDGAPDTDESLAIARALVAAGFHTVAPSPHTGAGPGGNVAAATATAARGRLAAQLAAADVPLRLLPNAEHHVTVEMLARARAGDVVPIGGAGRWLLVELPWHPIPRPAEVLHRLQVDGWRLLLAHPERYAYLEPEAALDLAARGVRLQVELGSLVGAYGARAQARAAALLDADAVHVLASDLHRASQAEAWLSAAVAAAHAHCGAAVARRLLEENPAAILAAAADARAGAVMADAAGARADAVMADAAGASAGAMAAGASRVAAGGGGAAAAAAAPPCAPRPREALP